MIGIFLETFQFCVSVNCSAFLYCAVFFVFFLSIDLLVCLFFPSHSTLRTYTCITDEIKRETNVGWIMIQFVLFFMMLLCSFKNKHIFLHLNYIKETVLPQFFLFFVLFFYNSHVCTAFHCTILWLWLRHF